MFLRDNGIVDIVIEPLSANKKAVFTKTKSNEEENGRSADKRIKRDRRLQFC